MIPEFNGYLAFFLGSLPGTVSVCIHCLICEPFSVENSGADADSVVFSWEGIVD